MSYLDDLILGRLPPTTPAEVADLELFYDRIRRHQRWAGRRLRRRIKEIEALIASLPRSGPRSKP